jgi:DNA replication protein DnaC
MSAAVKPMHEAAIRQYAKQLRLPTLGGQFARLAEQAVKEKQSHLSYLEALLEGEVEERGRKAMARRIQEARFPSVKTLEEFDFQCASHIPAALLRNLSEGGDLARKEPIIFLGETGTGKTHLATGLGGALWARLAVSASGPGGYLLSPVKNGAISAGERRSQGATTVTGKSGFLLTRR